MTASAERSYCADQVERFDNDRFLCAAFAGRERRDGLLALYAFNLEVARIREQAREPLLAQIRLQWWREAVEGIYVGGTNANPVVASLAATVRQYSLSFDQFERYLQGRDKDLDDTAPADLAALELYADETAGSLSALALQVLGVDSQAAATATRHAATAWALLGLLRAVPFHARARRVYLPADLNRRAGLDVFALFDKGEVPGLTHVVAAVAEAARQHLQAARLLRGDIPRAALPALLITTFADHYLSRLRRSDYNPFNPQVRTRSKTAILRLAINASLGRF